jgi:hypothetical protein
MHNIGVMHQERNVAESIISTCMNITGKIKDNFKTWRDIAHVCNRQSLELNERGGKPRALFCLKVKDRKEVMRWMKRLKFPDGYTAWLKRQKEEKLLTSFVVEPGAALDSLLGDGVDVTVLQKQKWQPVKKKCSTHHRRTEQDIANEKMEQRLRENEEYNLQV